MNEKVKKVILVSVVKRATPDCRASEAKRVKLVSRENKVQWAKKVKREMLA